MTGHTHQTVSSINQRLKTSSITLADLDKLDDSELHLTLYPKVKSKSYRKVPPDFEITLKECLIKHKFRKSIMVAYLEYKSKYGSQGYERSQFYKLFKDYLKAKNIVMKQIYVPGEIVFIDYTGLTLSYVSDSKDIKLNVFVACLGYSKRIFAFATPDMTSVSWCRSLYKALEYFGGVPDVVQFDNAKAMVTTPGQLATFHRNIQELSHYCGFVSDTSRVGTPTDNGNAEATAKFVTQRIIVPMKKDLSFFSIDEVNRYLVSEIDKLNGQQIQKMKITRNELFFADELHELAPLPVIPFAPVIYRKEIFTPSNYMVRYAGNEYSVPFELAHKRIEVKVKGDKLYIVYQSQIRAIHEIITGTNNVVRISEHLKPEHLAELNKTKENYIHWAEVIGSATVFIVEDQYKGRKSTSSRVAGKFCSRLQTLCKKYGEDVFEQACTYAYTHNMSSPNDIELILKAKPFLEANNNPVVPHSNIRGANYFGGGIMNTSLLNSRCKELRLDSIPDAVAYQLSQSGYEDIPFDVRLLELLNGQASINKAKKVTRLQKQANLRYPNVFVEDMKYELYPKLKISQFKQLQICDWIESQQHVLIIGPTGLGKTYLSCVLAQAAIALEIPVIFFRLSNLLLELIAAQNEGELQKFVKKVNRAKLLVIDDWGNAMMEKDERHLLFELIESRDKNGSLLITSQYPIDVWHTAFQDETIADSVLDRIVHSSHKIELKGDSIRKLIGVDGGVK
jgi:DNA replication protein DnaC/transposase